MFYSLVLRCFLRRISTLDGVQLNARSSDAKVNKAVETNSKCTQFFIDVKVLY